MDDFIVPNTRSDRPIVPITKHDDPENEDDGVYSETMENGQPSTSEASLVSPLPGIQQPSTSKAGLVHGSDTSDLPVLGIFRSERSFKRQSSVMFTAAPTKNMHSMKEQN
jgi:hypothetical protein